MNSNLKTSRSPARSHRPPLSIGNRQSAIGNPPRLGIRSRSAFTLLELLVVIGIILVLISLFFAGAKIVTTQAHERDTKTALATCQTMFANYQQDTHLSRIPPVLSTYVPPYSFYTSQEPAPVGQLTDPSQPNSAPSTLIQLVADTAYVMYAVEADPQNQKIIASLPSSKVVNVSITINGATVSVPLILDGYGSPILFVPGGGLGINAANELVWLDGVNAGIITSAGTITPSSTPYNIGTYAPAASTAGNLQNQPFFVSAGPDRDFSNSSSHTDDNIYSFQN